MECGENSFINQPEQIPQSDISKMAESYTGFKLEDPKIKDKLFEDYQQIIDKYGIPDMTLAFTDPKEYNKQLKDLLTENNIGILKKSETQDFFDENSEAYAAYFPEKRAIGINLNKQQDPDYSDITYFSTLTHELIHALQYDSPNPMSIQKMEYEAMLGSSAMNNLKDSEKRQTLPQKEIADFFEKISGSVDIFQRQKNLVKSNNIR